MTNLHRFSNYMYYKNIILHTQEDQGQCCQANCPLTSPYSSIHVFNTRHTSLPCSDCSPGIRAMVSWRASGTVSPATAAAQKHTSTESQTKELSLHHFLHANNEQDRTNYQSSHSWILDRISEAQLQCGRVSEGWLRHDKNTQWCVLLKSKLHS